MKRASLLLSCVAFLVSMLALHVAWRTKQDVQAQFHNLPAAGKLK
jgi:hypothetical protein